MTPFRRYLDSKPKGEVARLAAIADRTHAQISRIASGHRGASLSVAVSLSDATGLPPGAFKRPDAAAVPSRHKGQSGAKPGKSSVAKRVNGRGRR